MAGNKSDHDRLLMRAALAADGPDIVLLRVDSSWQMREALDPERLKQAGFKSVHISAPQELRDLFEKADNDSDPIGGLASMMELWGIIGSDGLDALGHAKRFSESAAKSGLSVRFHGDLKPQMDLLRAVVDKAEQYLEIPEVGRIGEIESLDDRTEALKFLLRYALEEKDERSHQSLLDKFNQESHKAALKDMAEIEQDRQQGRVLILDVIRGGIVTNPGVESDLLERHRKDLLHMDISTPIPASERVSPLTIGTKHVDLGKLEPIPEEPATPSASKPDSPQPPN